jgi:hypothetical protein
MLAHTRGLVQCGQCNRTFSALSFLFDEWPSGQAHGPAKGSKVAPPIIGKTKKTAQKNDKTENQENEEASRPTHNITWGLTAALLVLVTFANTAWTFREPLMQYPEVSQWLKESGWLQVEREGLLSDPDQIQLISRDMHSHPTRTGILVMSLTFVNLARRTQIFPTLGVTLLDASNQAIAHRRFLPADYLRPGADTQSGLAADVFLPVLLELGDPGEQAVGFEIQFF